MPRANQDRYNPLGRVPRTIFQHAHCDNIATFPPLLGGGGSGEAFLLVPDNWNGLDKLYLWLLGGWTGQLTAVNITINIASCDEAFNVHTQTVNANIINTVNNEYECFDLTTIFATVLANLAARDMIWIVVTVVDEQAVYMVGLEAQET